MQTSTFLYCKINVFVLVAIDLIVQHIRDILNNKRNSEERHMEPVNIESNLSPAVSPAKRSNSSNDAIFKRPH